MNPLRVARIPYLNSVPFYQRMASPGIELLDLPPRELGEAARLGGVDAGIMSMCDVFRIPGFAPLGDLGIAVDGPAHSVLLFSKTPPAELGAATIAVTSETSTSYPLLRVLLEQRYGVVPAAFVRRPEGPRPTDDAALLIGDSALIAAARAGLLPGRSDYSNGLIDLTASSIQQPWRWVLDLAQDWKQWQDRPFVFARWMIRRDIDAPRRDWLLESLSESVEASLRGLQSLAAAEAGPTGLPADAAQAYLMGFNYRFGGAEREAIERFRGLLARAPWWEQTQPEAVARRRQ